MTGCYSIPDFSLFEYSDFPSTQNNFITMRSSFLGFKQQFLIFGFCGLLLSGCAVGNLMTDSSESRENRQPPMKQDGSGKVAGRDMLMPALTSINNRIYTYEQKLEEWKEAGRKSASLSLPQEKLNKINECTSQLNDILTDYNSLRNRLLQETRAESTQLLVGDSLLQLNQQDIDYLEGGCSKLLAELKAAPKAEAVATVAAVDPQIKAAFENADYDRVITLYGQLTSTPGVVPAHENTFQYGQSLLKNHQEAMARKVFTDLLARVRQQQGQEALLLQLMQVTGDLDFSTGSYEEARKRYEELVRVSTERGAHKEEWAGVQLAGLQSGSIRPEEMQDYCLLLKNYLTYTPKRDGYAVAEQAEKFLLTYPASRLVASVNIIDKTTREQADAWLNQGIKRIETQAGERKSQEQATPVEPSVPATLSTLGDQKPVKSAEPSVTTPQAPVFDEKILQDDYNKGMKLLEAKEYEKAIDGFNKLLKTPYEEKARARIEEAARLGAQEDRQKAADLFVRSNSSHDQESKKKLLLSSRQLLQGILVKYPQSGLTDKVQKNLGRIEEELKAIDPHLLTAPSSKGAAYVPPATTPGARPVSSLSTP